MGGVLLESLLQDIAEFPKASFVLSPVLILFSFFFVRFIKPNFPCKYKKPLILVYLLACIFIIHIGSYDVILWKEDLTTLKQQQGTLELVKAGKGQHGGYFLCSPDGKQRQQLTFILCYHINPDLYLHQKMVVWHRYGYVYQVSVNRNIIDTLEDSNRKIWLANLFNMMYWLLVFSGMLIPYFFILRSFNSDGGR